MTTLARRPVSSTLRGLAVATVLALALGACSDDEPAGGDADADGDSASASADPGDEADDEAGDEGSEEAAPDPEGDEGDEGDRPVLPAPPAIDRPQGATEDVTTRSCRLEAGEQSIGGQVTNPTGRALDYVITVSWVSDDARVRGRGVAVVDDVPPGETRRWRATAEVLDDAATCVTNALRGRTEA